MQVVQATPGISDVSEVLLERLTIGSVRAVLGAEGVCFGPELEADGEAV